MALARAFYQRDILTVARELLGKTLVHQTEEGTTAGRIVEVEAYCGPEDKGAHSYGGRKTPRNEVMYGEKGHAYVYLIYGLYNCINITAGDMPGKPEAVLIRALEPISGQELIVKRRGAKAKLTNLTNGPGRLCMAMGITRQQNKADITMPPLYVEDTLNVPANEVVEKPRIGIDYADEWKDKPWRLYIKGNSFVSVK